LEGSGAVSSADPRAEDKVAAFESDMMVVELNFAEFSSEIARDYFGKCHEPSLWVGRHGEAALEGSSAVSNADPGAEDKGVAAFESDGWLNEDGSRRVRHMIFGEIPYLVHQLSVF
jgi:hypothetical protein